MRTKKKVVYVSMVLVLIILSYVNRDLFISPPTVTLEMAPVVNNNGHQQINASVSQPLTPDRAIIVQAVTDLSAQIVSHAPNQLEAFFSAAEAQSLRIQTIRTQRIELGALEKKAEYEKNLYSAKASHAEVEVLNSLQGKSEDKSQNRYNPTQYTMSHQNIGREEVKVEKPKKSLAEFTLKSIRSLESGYRAVVSDGSTDYSVSIGFELPGGVSVKAISAESVTLASADKSQTLFVF